MRTEELLPVLGSLERQGLAEVEVFAKSSRARHFAVSVAGEAVCFSEEAGWAIRAGDRHGSFFIAGAGSPAAAFPWPETDGGGLELPDPSLPVPWSEPAETSSPLVGEREGLNFLRHLGAELANELPGARLLAASLEDGLAESHLVNRRGVRASWRNRVAALALDAAGPSGAAVSLGAAEREARNLPVQPLARRLANALTVAAGKPIVEEGRAEALLAPAVAARLLAGLLPLWVGPGARERAERLSERDGKIASPSLTLVDNGRLPSGALAAPFDAEGSPTREVVLVAQGRLQGSLSGACGSGTLRRPGWRDVPRPGPSHLYIQPAPRVSVASLLARVGRGYYFLDAPGAGAFDLEADNFRLPVRGFLLDQGRAAAAVAGLELRGSPLRLLHSVLATARDLTFFPLDGMLGAPTLLVSGVEVGEER